MEQNYYNGGLPYLESHDNYNKKDKKKFSIQSKLSKLNESFILKKDFYYTQQLQDLQINLSTIHNGTNEILKEKIKDIEESRDYELVDLRLWEQFQVQRAEKEFFEDIAKTENEHDEFVKLAKEKLYANLERQIKQLKEDKVLLDLANSHSYHMDTLLTNVSDFHKNTRSSHNLKDSSISAMGYMSDRRGLRRRYDYSTNPEDSHLSANDSGNNSSSKRRRPQGYQSSNDDGLVSDTADLSSILFGNDKRNDKVSTRHSSKPSFTTPPGLKTEEVNEDLTLLKSAVKS